MNQTISNLAPYKNHCAGRFDNIGGSYVDESINARNSRNGSFSERTILRFEPKPRVCETSGVMVQKLRLWAQKVSGFRNNTIMNTLSMFLQAHLMLTSVIYVRFFHG